MLKFHKNRFRVPRAANRLEAALLPHQRLVFLPTGIPFQMSRSEGENAFSRFTGETWDGLDGYDNHLIYGSIQTLIQLTGCPTSLQHGLPHSVNPSAVLSGQQASPSFYESSYLSLRKLEETWNSLQCPMSKTWAGKQCKNKLTYINHQYNAYMCTYTCIYIYIYVCVCASVSVYVSVCVWVYLYPICRCVYMCMCVCVCDCVCVSVYLCIYISMYLCICVCMHACMHVCMYACTHVRMYACTHVRMWACVHVCMCACLHVWYAHCMLLFEHNQHIWIQAALLHELHILMLQHHDVQCPGRPFELHNASTELWDRDQPIISRKNVEEGATITDSDPEVIHIGDIQWDIKCTHTYAYIVLLTYMYVYKYIYIYMCIYIYTL